VSRKVVSPIEVAKYIDLPTSYGFERIKKLHGNLALPSYVHGYSLAIEYMYNWFKSKFDKDFFRGGIYIDGKNVLDDYKRLNEYAMKNIIKGQNPRARMEPRVQFDYDREGIDLYQAPAEVYLRRSKFEDSFFKDYDRDLFLGIKFRTLRMDVAYKVRLNSRSQQLDTYNRMELYFRNGATQYEYISVDFHVPKYIMLNIANKAGFEIKNGEITDIIEFTQYLNRHSDIPFLFKLRAINQHQEFFIRVNNLYTHILVNDKLQLDDGERDGKLDFNFHVEMTAQLDIPIPHYYSFYSSEELTSGVKIQEANEGCVAVYSINIIDIPKVDEHGWMQCAVTDYQTDEGDKSIDISPIFSGSSTLTKAITQDLTVGISPSKYINIKVYRDDDIAKEVVFKMDWKNMKIIFRNPEPEEILHIAIYYDREYINNLEIEMNKYNDSRVNVSGNYVPDNPKLKDNTSGIM
jgi:hypothetical protein